MRESSCQIESYGGFEQGPIRPPSEARSLLIRVTRNCPWNRCTFCPVYKGGKFSIRSVEHVKRDIDAVHEQVQRLVSVVDATGHMVVSQMGGVSDNVSREDHGAFAAALHWVRTGHMKSVFLQDANSLAIRADQLVEILGHLKTRFPMIVRTTSYARSQTIAGKRKEDLVAIHGAGLDRIHIGLESGCDEVLQAVHKGSTRAQHIEAGLKVKQAGMELSEYVMPGLGGRTLSERHAIDTADALNRINPDFIRLRTLAIPPYAPLYEEWQTGAFTRCTDVEIARELAVFLSHLDGITGVIQSDHVLNLFEDLEGQWPGDAARMLAILEAFLTMASDEQRLYQVGRRLGVFRRLADMENPHKRAAVADACRQFNVTPENLDEFTHSLMTRHL